MGNFGRVFPRYVPDVDVLLHRDDWPKKGKTEGPFTFVRLLSMRDNMGHHGHTKEGKKNGT
jgi:hypothetical protein